MSLGAELGGARNARRVVGYSGRWYLSRLQRDRANELYVLQQAGEISDLVEEPYIRDLYAGISYRPDFRYVERGELIHEEAKGVYGDRFRIVCKLWALHGPTRLRITARRGRHGRITMVREIVPKGAV